LLLLFKELVLVNLPVFTYYLFIYSSLSYSSMPLGWKVKADLSYWSM